MAFDPNSTYSTFVDAEGEVYISQGGFWYDRNGNVWSAQPRSKKNGYTAGTGLTSAQVAVLQPMSTGALNQATSTFRPWKIASYGDSRANSGSSSPDVSTNSTLTDLRVPAWAAALMFDAEHTHNFGVSGDTAALWSSLSRTGGKTFLALGATDVDLVIIQYGVNDCVALTAAATTVANLKALIAEVLKSNKKVVFESILPINSTGSASYVAIQALIDSVNASMQAWIATLNPAVIAYADSATLLKDSTGYLSTTYSTDGVHPLRQGAKICGRVVAAAARTLLPRRTGLFPARDNKNPNLINVMSPNVFTAFEAGTATGSITPTTGQDADGFYTEFIWTPATFVSGECRARLDISANFQTANPPAYSLVGSELLQGSVRIKCDNGTSGGVPNAYAVGVRQRFYTGAIFSAWGVIPAGAPSASQPDLVEADDMLCITPYTTNAAASVVANPSDAGGWQIQVYVSSQRQESVRVRMYNPQLRVIGYKTTPISVTPPASTVAYTNSTPVKQQVVISGGTVTVIAQGGVTTGLISGVFVLDPADTLTLTYTVAPTMLVKHLA